MMTTGQFIRIPTWRGRHGIRVAAKIEIAFGRWPANSIAYQTLITLREQASIEPLSHEVLHKLKRALHFISDKGAAFLKSPIGAIDQSRLIGFLESIDTYFSDIEHVQSTKHNYATSIRKMLEFAPDDLADGESLRATLAEFVPRHRRTRRLRIDKLPEELGQLRHHDLQDLEAKAEGALRTKLASVESAVEAAFEAYRTALEYQQSIIPDAIAEEEETNLRRWLFSNRSYGHLLAKLDTAPTRLAGNILLILSSTPVDLSNRGWPICRFPTHRRLRGLPQVRDYICHSSAAPWFLARHRLPNPVITAIFIQLAAHTAWNPASLSTLSTNGIYRDPATNAYRIQAYKRRTDDDTPAADIPTSARLTHRALTLLLWNHKQLKRLGVIPPDEQRLWFGWGHDQRKPQDPIDKFKVRRFCSVAGIDGFTVSELRPLKASIAYLSQKDIEAVRVLLGHTHLAVTDTYLRDSIFFRLNEANILRFQRQIESTLVFVDGGDARLNELGLRKEDVKDPHLWSTGDGGLCSSPFGSHPSQRKDEQQVCAGLHCHYQDGCPSHRLYVTSDSIELALRTVEFYKSKWSELYQRNPDAFSKLHLPRLLYIRVLLDVVDDRRPDLLAAARRNIA